MVGMIVTGHGSFAAGITSGIRLLAGEPECFEAVDFLPEDSADTLAEKLRAAAGRLKGCEGIVLFADLAGGSPFNVAVRMKMETEEGLEVIGGANLPVVLNAYMSRPMGMSAKELAESSLEAGRDAMVRFDSVPDSGGEYEE